MKVQATTNVRLSGFFLLFGATADFSHSAPRLVLPCLFQRLEGPWTLLYVWLQGSIAVKSLSPGFMERIQEHCLAQVTSSEQQQEQGPESDNYILAE